MSRVGGKIRVGRVTPIQQFFFFGLIFNFINIKIALCNLFINRT